MKSVKMVTSVFVISLLVAGNLMAQRGHFRPDSLATVTLTGKVMVKTITVQDTLRHKNTVVVRRMTRYLLDTDTNGIAEYELNFGPAWYKPDSSSALRPLDGDQVTIKGGEPSRLTRDSLKMVVVYEINGNLWRDPLDAIWNKMGTHSNDRDHGGKGPKGYGFGFMHDSLTTVTVSGKIIADTTFVNERFFIDTNNDSIPDYGLNFGPYWYTPSSGAIRPEDGESVEISGGLLNRNLKPMIIVYKINGQVWLDSTIIGKDLGGCWIRRDSRRQSKFHSPFDPKSFVGVNPGWAGGMMGNMMEDQMYGQVLELMPCDVPNGADEKVLAAFEVSLFDQYGNNTLLKNGMRGNHVNFASTAQVQLHFNDYQIRYGNFTENNITAKYWDNNSNQWVEVRNAAVNTTENTVSFQQSTVSNLIILTAAQTVSAVEDQNAAVAESYQMKQNYPNPFNPSTVISYSISKPGMVMLKVFNILGKEVATLVNGNQAAGTHSVEFNASNLPSGIYIYTIKAGEFTASRKLMLLK
ncbi:MAG: T9SS type A sorting domain-containing protein [Ignavibacteria bacterium]|jgi:hypothetical protein|nr:T9SS type A sorting domain-containing protein [Ignavibacteria bacterium]MCU7504582.1 T9SS type A sorting domain-containing protein [Ignavibacteria bacterium]MCU7516580.1 T9SS type A sorting domain-containing protein [Ignavibacteria bacterium]